MNLFSTDYFLHVNNLVEDVIPKFFDGNVNNTLTMMPSYEEIHNVAFSLSMDGVPNVDSFEHTSFKPIHNT